MRRSCAPSVQSNAKRLCFLPLHSEKENSVFDVSDFNFDSIKPAVDVSPKIESSSSLIRSRNKRQESDDVFKLLFDNLDTDIEIKKGNDFMKPGVSQTTDLKNINNDDCNIKETKDVFQKETVQVTDCSHYNVMWCKRSTKKHKVWEGDGILTIKGRCAVLKNTDGVVIDRCSGLKLKEVDSLEDGSHFYIGGKECEIQNQVSPQEVDFLFTKSEPEISSTYKKIRNDMDKQEPKASVKVGGLNNEKKPFMLNNSYSKQVQSSNHLTNFCNSTQDILNLIDDALSTNTNSPSLLSLQANENYSDLKNLKSEEPVSFVDAEENNLAKETNTHLLVEENNRVEICYSVLWCKQSCKKHKTWEGDGTLTIKDRGAILKNAEGKIIDRGIGYKLKQISALEEGSRFCVGGKECEIQSLLTATKLEENNEKEYISPFTFLHKRGKFNCPLKTVLTKTYEKSDLDSLILPEPNERVQAMYNIKKLPITEVGVDGFLSKLLRPHQKEGVIFLYKCILGFQHEYGLGAILADEMGLGKTLQCIALIWTLFKKGPYGGKPILKRTIIITPSSLVMNWKKEFKKWLGDSRLQIHAIDKKHTVKEFVKYPKDVLIISYEMFLRSAEALSPIPFDLVICDEGHRIKNLNIKISSVINCLSTDRRILLTGTPIQNDLAEFFSLVDFVNPGALGSIKSFKRSFEKPIAQARDTDCTEEEKEMGEEQSEELNRISCCFMLRRTQEVINQFLPSKSETVVFCRPSELQRRLCSHLLDSVSIWGMLSGTAIDPSQHLIYISLLRKLCNHPSLLCSDKDIGDNHTLNAVQSIIPSDYHWSSQDSGKMKVLEKILESLFSSRKKEKIVIVSNFTQTLNILEELCKTKKYFYLRLDGSTISSNRQDLVDVFNKSYTKYNVFLLSSKAGGVGFNLIGASRIVLYDIDWNPAHDLQAMARIWRDGQKHSVHIYRLLTTGTIEEKIYQRQISKQCLSGSVLKPNSSEKLKFSRDELKDLFTFHGDTDCLTHDMINCQCLDTMENDDSLEATENKPENVKAIGMEELMNWTHIPGSSQSSISDIALASCNSDISFLFMNKTNVQN